MQPRPGGLPSGPRSRSIGRSRPEDAPSRSRQPEPPTPSLRSQRSTASLPRGPVRSRPPPASVSSRDRSQPSRSYESRYGDTTDTESRTSYDSAGSSLFDRMNSRRRTGYVSSRTSVDEDMDDSTGYKTPEVKMSSLRSRRIGQSLPPADNSYQSAALSASGNDADGYTIWSRVASAASEMTISVSKAWASGIETFAGEETPPGGESRLTRAMKAYHREKAQTPADLPDWLFGESERRISRRNFQSPSRQHGDDEYEAVERRPATEQRRRRGLRDIYDDAATSAPTPSAPERPPVGRFADEAPQPSRATDRLKALRDAKRGAAFATASPASREDTEDRREAEPLSARQVRRMGLPSAPNTRARRL